MVKVKKAAVVATGWVGDTIACSAAATTLYDNGYKVSFYVRWPQLKSILDNDKRFETIVFGQLLTCRIKRPLFPSKYDLIVDEPKGWSYEEPFTAEIRRLAGFVGGSEYSLFLSPSQIALHISKGSRPVISIARDIYKRAYGRNIPELIESLSLFAEICWVGLSPEKNSKRGKSNSLVEDASKIYNSDLFVGVEGGLLWLAAGLGTRCVYFTEHILEVAKKCKRGDPFAVLGSKNIFPNSGHIDLPVNCENEYAVDVIQKALIEVESGRRSLLLVPK
jgi:hypothetical protein